MLGYIVLKNPFECQKRDPKGPFFVFSTKSSFFTTSYMRTSMPAEKFLDAAQSALDEGCKATASATLIAAGCTIQQLPEGEERDALVLRHGELHAQAYGRYALAD